MTHANDDRAARAALSLLLPPDDLALHSLAADGAAAVLMQAAKDGRRAPVAPPQPSDLMATGRRLLEQADRDHIRIVVPGDTEWPALAAGFRPPACLWVRGNGDLGSLRARSLAIVGSRAATAYGQHIAADLAYNLAAEGVCLVSGGDFGTSAAAIRASLTAGDTAPGPILVLPSGVDRPHPHAHAELIAQVADTGVLVSAQPPGAAPTRRGFEYRDRLLAAATTIMVVVEATRMSRSFAMAIQAHAWQRTVLAVPGPVTSVHSTGCHDLIRAGQALLVSSTRDILTHLVHPQPGPVTADPKQAGHGAHGNLGD